MANPASEKALFEKYLPLPAVDYCFNLWQKYAFSFKITRHRNSKLGDYRYVPTTKEHTITVNGSLNKYSFLVTYLHEVAHLETKIFYKKKVAPHGIEWKRQFQQLLEPVLNTDIFPDTVLKALNKYVQNPKASSCADVDLLKALQSFDAPKGLVYVADLAEGERFIYQEREFIKQKKNRTRILCLEKASGRVYSFSSAAMVKAEPFPIQDSVEEHPPVPQAAKISLEMIKNGQKFKFRERIFVKEALIRTKVKCMEPATGKFFLISKNAPVSLV